MDKPHIGGKTIAPKCGAKVVLFSETCKSILQFAP